MQFVYVPILDEMIAVYQKPRTPEERFFGHYLKLIQTPSKKDLQHPLPFFNPMAKDHILEKLQTLKKNGFEEKLALACQKNSTSGPLFQTYFNLADDIGGGWTTKESTHEMSLSIAPFFKRNFCVIVFYASETITDDLIAEKVKFYTDLYSNYTPKK
ncbi:MAG TPA: hypothetical protein PKD96_00225 [Candidatus Absconditabacterales bacterium]|nr:hypothetical protein [Candidatus Absconditabacterales bacterium]HMT26705.1 hypothetical protein [Candidatus Absconditabacterales bacterium]